MTGKKRWGAALAAIFLTAALVMPAAAAEIPMNSTSAVLMEKTTGQVLYAQNEHQAMEPASVTKIMTLLLTMEAIDGGKIHYDDVVTVSAHAASMGGSQVYLSEGEQITVEDLIKSVCVSSGNDAAVALAEYVSGVEELFVEAMNEKAAALGMNDTHFENPTGLTAKGHVTSAYDIALMSRELIFHHPDIRQYTTIWMDTIRGGTFGLSNTNKLVRYYDGCTGLKTGYTSSAGYCMSATAEKGGMELIAAVMHAPTADQRNTDAKALLNYGFSAYELVAAEPEEPLPSLPVTLGKAGEVKTVLRPEEQMLLLEKGKTGALTQTVELPETVAAPIEKGQQLGTLTVYDGETVLCRLPILAAEDVAKCTWWEIFSEMAAMALFIR